MLYYKVGDATSPEGEGNKIITHICNDIGGWGRGFVVAVSKRWSLPEALYRELRTRTLGQVQFVDVENDITVANMIAQHGVKTINGIPPIRYEALRECLKTVSKAAKRDGATVHMPRIGAGLAGGKWEEIEKIILETLNCDVTVYDIPNNPIPWK